MTERIYNFSAGPAALPLSVLEQAQQDLISLGDTGIGVLEHSHRSKAFIAVYDEAEALCREIASIPDNYKVLFLQGGASTQFSMISTQVSICFLPTSLRSKLMSNSSCI